MLHPLFSNPFGIPVFQGISGHAQTGYPRFVHDVIRGQVKLKPGEKRGFKPRQPFAHPDKRMQIGFGVGADAKPFTADRACREIGELLSPALNDIERDVRAFGKPLREPPRQHCRIIWISMKVKK